MGEVVPAMPWPYEDDYNDVKEDMQEGCGAHGKLVMALCLHWNGPQSSDFHVHSARGA